MAESAKPTLYYFGVHARGEPLRMCLSQAGIDFENKIIDHTQLAALKADGTLPAG